VRSVMHLSCIPCYTVLQYVTKHKMHCSCTTHRILHLSETTRYVGRNTYKTKYWSWGTLIYSNAWYSSTWILKNTCRLSRYPVGRYYNYYSNTWYTQRNRHAPFLLIFLKYNVILVGHTCTIVCYGINVLFYKYGMILKYIIWFL
jgi:hypothetical protein